MLNWIISSRLDIRSKLRIAYDLLYVLAVYRVEELAFLPVACSAMFYLNRYARQANKHNAQPIYDLKNRFVRMLYKFGYCQSVTRQKQILPCWACEGRDTTIRGAVPANVCWKCGGTGIHRTVTLYRFDFNVRGTRWIWHQPQGLIGWPVDVTDEDPEPYRRLGDVESQSKKEVGRSIVIVWAALRFTCGPQLTLPGLPGPNKSYRHIPFPTKWFENQFWAARLNSSWYRRTCQTKRFIEQIKMRLLRRFWPPKFEELYGIPF